jgi:hypothetical protein
MNYFVPHKGRLNYCELLEQGRAIGSSAVEGQAKTLGLRLEGPRSPLAEEKRPCDGELGVRPQLGSVGRLLETRRMTPKKSGYTQE